MEPGKPEKDGMDFPKAGYIPLDREEQKKNVGINHEWQEYGRQKNTRWGWADNPLSSLERHLNPREVERRNNRGRELVGTGTCKSTAQIHQK